MKKLYTVLLVLLLAGVLAVGALSLVDEDPTESQTENRKLAALPEFSWEALLSGDYLTELETYYSDTFPGREMLLGVNQKLNGFYHYSGGGEENNMLVLDFQGGAEMVHKQLGIQQTGLDEMTGPEQIIVSRRVKGINISIEDMLHSVQGIGAGHHSDPVFPNLLTGKVGAAVGIDGK